MAALLATHCLVPETISNVTSFEISGFGSPPAYTLEIQAVDDAHVHLFPLPIRPQQLNGSLLIRLGSPTSRAARMLIEAGGVGLQDGSGSAIVSHNGPLQLDDCIALVSLAGLDATSSLGRAITAKIYDDCLLYPRQQTSEVFANLGSLSTAGYITRSSLLRDGFASFLWECVMWYFGAIVLKGRQKR